MYQVIEMQSGARTVYLGPSFEAAEKAFASISHGKMMEVRGRDENGKLIPGIMGENITLEVKGLKAL